MLEAHDITFGYRKGAPVLQGLSLSIAPGERVALAAPSGAGKTTLCRLLAGYEAPWSGTVLANGAPLPRQGRCPVQLIGQHPELALDPRMTLAASLAEALGNGHRSQQKARLGKAGVGGSQDGKGEAPRKGHALAEKSMAKEHARPGAASEAAGATPASKGHGPASLDACKELLDRFGIQQRWLSRYPRELSGGELQRLCIVRALLARPAYLIADEMTTSLDAISQASIWHELLAELDRRRMGLAFTTHSPALAARIATRTVKLESQAASA